MYVCMYVCLHVCMYVCMYVSIYLSIYLSIYVCLYVCIHLFLHIILCTSMSISASQRFHDTFLGRSSSEVSLVTPGLVAATGEASVESWAALHAGWLRPRLAISSIFQSLSVSVYAVYKLYIYMYYVYTRYVYNYLKTIGFFGGRIKANL